MPAHFKSSFSLIKLFWPAVFFWAILSPVCSAQTPAEHIRIGVYTNTPPYAFIEDSGTPKGIFIDYIRELERRINLPFHIVETPSFAAAWDLAAQGQLDMLVAATPSEKHKKEFNLSEPYHIAPVVLITREKYPTVRHLKEFVGKTIVVNKNQITEQWIQTDYPGIMLMPVEDYKTGLRMVSENKADAYAGGMPVLTWYIRQNRITNLKIAATTEYEYRLSFALKKDTKTKLKIEDVNMALREISPEEKEKIFEKWVSLPSQAAIDWKFVRNIIGTVVFLSTIICLIIYLWNLRLQNEINKKERIEKALKESERQMAALIGNLPGIVYRCRKDRHWTMLYISDGCKKITGYDSDELIMNKKIAYSDLIHEEDQDRISEQVNLALQKKEPFTIEYRIKDRHGNEKWLWEKGSGYFNETSRSILLEGVIIDISNRKKMEIDLLESEKNLLEAQQITRMGSWVWDMATDKVSCSPEMLKIMTLDENTRVVKSRVIFDRIHKEDIERVRRKLNDAIKNGGLYETEFRIVLPKGRIKIIHGLGNPVYDMNGTPVMVKGTGQDVTESRELEKRLNQAQKMEAIGTLAGGIAHDFNNILSSMLGFAQVALHSSPKESDIVDDLKEIVSAGHRARDLVRQILTFARRTGDDISPIQVAPIAKEVLKFIRSTIPSNVELKTDINTTSAILGNPSQVHQVFLNLLTNAAQAMDENGGCIDVKIDEISPKATGDFELSGPAVQKQIRIIISDTGQGIAEDLLETIFEPYFTTKQKSDGTGLGLATVRSIIESYHGTIRVESRLKKGTCFTVHLPVCESCETKPASTVSPSVPVKGKEHLLLIDDETAIIKLNKKILEKLGYRITAQTSSEQALSLFKQDADQFDLVVTDMTMPKVSGYQVAEQMIKIRPDIPIILCTGYSNTLSNVDVSKTGIRAVLEKPVSMNQLSETIRSVLDTGKP